MTLSQDALTKTVPIWAAVLNRAVAAHRAVQLQDGTTPAAPRPIPHQTPAPPPSEANVACPVDSQPPMHPTSSDTARSTAQTAPPSDGWDTDVHLPPWISSNELHQIEQRMAGWVQALQSVGANIGALSERLTKPLRPLWLSQRSRIWVNQV